MQSDSVLSDGSGVPAIDRESAYALQKETLSGAPEYRGLLNRHREQLQQELYELRRLPDGTQKAQIAEVETALGQIQTLDSGVQELIDRGAGGRGLEIFAAPRGLETMRAAVAELMAANATRVFHRMAVQGPLMETIDHHIDHCGGRHADAVILMLDYMNEVVTDPASGQSKLWRFMTPANPDDGGMAIWLYSHHPTQKYRSMYFRLSVQRFIDSLVLNLESYIPFGSLGDDPAQYAMDESQVYTRPGWLGSSVLSHSANLTNTTNLSFTKSTNFGRTLGDSVSETLSTGTSESDTTGISESSSSTYSESKSTSWGRNWSYSSGDGNSSGGGTTSTSAYSSTKGTHASNTTGTSTGESTAISRNTGTSYGLSLSECEGISKAQGEGIQVSTWNYGIDLGESNETHLKRWKQSHADAARQYKGVQDMFKKLCQKIERNLQTEDSSYNANTSIEVRAREINSKILIKLDSNLRVLPGQQSVAALPPEWQAVFEHRVASAKQSGLIPSEDSW